MRLASASEKVFHKSHMEEIIKHSLSRNDVFYGEATLKKNEIYTLMLKLKTIFQIGTFLIFQVNCAT